MKKQSVSFVGIDTGLTSEEPHVAVSTDTCGKYVASEGSQIAKPWGVKLPGCYRIRGSSAAFKIHFKVDPPMATSPLRRGESLGGTLLSRRKRSSLHAPTRGVAEVLTISAQQVLTVDINEPSAAHPWMHRVTQLQPNAKESA